MPSFIVATQLYNTMTLRKVLLICSILIFIGSWMRLLSKPFDSIWWLIAGQTIIGTSSPLTTGGVSIIANYWFADNERGKATSFMMMSNPFGIFVSFFIQVLYSISINNNVKNSSDPEDEAKIIYTKEGVQQMLLIETIFTSFACLYFWVVFRTSRPPSAPSLAATRR